MIKILAVAGVVLLLSGPLDVVWIYSVNPSDFSYNITVPLFDEVVLGLSALGVISLVLSLVSKMEPRRANAIGVALMLVPVAVFLVGNMTTETPPCFGPCGSFPLLSSSSCMVDTKTCALVVVAGTVNVEAVNCTLGVGGRGQGILSNRVGGPPTPVDISAGSSVTVYCSQYQQTPTSGARAVGYVQFSNGLELAFSTIWA